MNKKIVLGMVAIAGFAVPLLFTSRKGGASASPETAAQESPKQAEADEARRELMRQRARRGGKKSAEARRRKKREREAAKTEAQPLASEAKPQPEESGELQA